VHRLRSESDAIVVGIGTVLADDPELTVRPDPGHQPLRVVVDSDGRTPAAAKVCGDGAETLVLTERDAGRHDAAGVLRVLHDRGIVRVLLEGGPTLAASFLAAGLVDRVVAYVAPALLGDGPPALAAIGVGTINDAVRLRLCEVSRLGDDVRLTLRRD
jgi:diaminohydroxyphosphoribosylaminopyrimidine deaminase/5-amino-6-(5-phosphoribosylamino)uracil reductase